MPSANTSLRDQQIQHAVHVLGYSNSVQRDINKLLTDLEQDCVGKIGSKLAGVKTGRNMSAKETERVNDLIGEIRVLTNGVYDKAHDHLKTEFIDFAQSEAEFNNKAINVATRSKIANRLPSPARLKAIVTADPLHGEILGPWVKRMGDSTGDRLAQQIRQGAAAGEKVDKIVERVVGVDGFTGSRTSARAMVRTSLNAIAAQTQQETWAANSDIIKGWQFVGTLDSRTTLICSSLDGQVFPLGEGPMPPRHWNCRSATIAVTKSHDEMGIKGKQYTASTRASMDGQIAAPIRMEAFLRSKDEAFQDSIFRSKQRADLWRRGKLNLNDFIRNYDEVIPLDELRRLHPEAFAGEADVTMAVPATPKPATKPVAPKVFSPVDPNAKASTVAVRPRKTVAQDLTRLFTNAKGDTRYDPRPEFRGMKTEDFGKASLTGLTDEASSMVAALMPEVDAICDAFAIPRLRAIKTGEGKSYIARMGDGTLTLNPIFINGYAGEIGEKTGSTVLATMMRDECLNEHLFPSLAAARRIIEAWRTDYNTVRPHSSLGGMAPAEFTNRPRQGHMETEAKLSAA